MSLTSAEKKEKNIVELEIAVGAEELSKAADKVFKRKAKDIIVPGFRKGKAPRKIIEKMYGEGVFLEDAVNDLYPQFYSEAIDEAGYTPVDRANVEILTIDKDKGFTFKATVTVKPEVSVKDYKGVQVEKLVSKVTDEQIDAEIERMRQRGARMITVDDRPAKLDDEAIIDFECFVDGVPFEGGKGEGQKLALGSHSFIDNFEEQIVGHSAGDEFDVNVTFPEEYHAEELKGKPAVFKVKLHEIQYQELPELDDEFAKDVSEFDTVAELREDLRKKAQENLDKQAEEQLENDLIVKICENMEADIPEVMFENKADDLMRDFEYRLRNQGMGLDMYLQYMGMELSAFRETFKEPAIRQVKGALVIEKIAQLEQVEVTDEDLAKEYEKLAEQYSMELDQVKGLISDKDLTADLKNVKAVELLKASAVVTEVERKEEKAEEEEPKPKKKAAPKKKKAEAEKPAEEAAEEKPKKPRAKKEEKEPKEDQ